MTQWNRSNNPQILNNILQTHFDNINILANSIHSSQDIITRIQRESITDTNNNRQNNTTNLFERIFNDEINTRTSTLRRRSNLNQNNNQYNGGSTNVPVDNNFVYLFAFDTLGTTLQNNDNAYTQTQSVSFETLLITNNNKHIVNDDVSCNDNNDSSRYHLFEISHFDLIQNPINDVCPITRERFDSTTEVTLMIKKCKHIFNKSALNIWLEHNNTCPCCRREIT